LDRDALAARTARLAADGLVQEELGRGGVQLRREDLEVAVLAVVVALAANLEQVVWGRRRLRS